MLRFVESWDSTDGGSIISGKWNYGRNPGSGITLTSAGRFGNGWHGDNRRSYKQFSDQQQTWIVGEAANLSAQGQTASLMAWIDFVNNVTQAQMIYTPSSTTISFSRGLTPLGLSYTFPGGVSSGQFYFIEWYLTISPTVGVIKLRIDGQVVINATGLNTQASALAAAGGFNLGSINDQFPLAVVDDIYICDGQVGGGSNPCNDFIGDCRVWCLFPNGNGNSSQWVGSDSNSVDNYLLVDEATPNGDTDYVESNVIGNKDTYTYQDLSGTTGTVYGVQVLPFARKVDAGFRSIKPIARLGGVEVDGAERFVNTSYQYYPYIYDTKPGGGDWTVTDFNNAEFGQKVFA